MTRLCVPLTSDTCDGMVREISAARHVGADMVELRLDFLRDWDAESIGVLASSAQAFDGGVIVTCRLAEEGGNWDGDERDRLRLFELAVQAADYIDVEYEAWRRSAVLREGIGTLRSGGESRLKLILSKHDFAEAPADPGMILDEIAEQPCDVVKLACKANAITDAVRMLDALRASAARQPTIALSMGETGILTRVLAKKLGALLTFASLETGKGSAPGQITIEQMRSLYRWEAIGEATKVYGVIGCPVGHSMSPAIMNAAFDEVGHDGVYLPMRVEPDFESFKAFLDACLARPWLTLRGCSVTIPHKKNLIDYVQQWIDAGGPGEIEPLAKRIGVANTLVIEPQEQGAAGFSPRGLAEEGVTLDYRLSACNTDYAGALDALADGIGCGLDGLKGLSIAVLGAGGVARAIVAGLRDCGCAVTLYNRTAERATALAEEFGAKARPWDERIRTDANVVINCTSIGMWPDTDKTPLPHVALSEDLAVFDTVYNPVETRLLREAREHGCTTIDGVSMFVNQAVGQFERWTGRPAPRDRMRRVVIERLRT